MNSGENLNDNWFVEYKPVVLSKDIKIISSVDKVRIKKAIENKLQVNPFLFSKPLSGFKVLFYKFRVGDYRVVWYEEKGKIIVVVIISHRKNVYEKFKNRYKL